MFSEKVDKISPSLTLAIQAEAKAMKKKGIDVVSLSAGEPDFDTPKNIKEKAKVAIDKGFTKYTPSSGMLLLKEAIIKKFKKDNGLDYTTEQVLVSCGAKYAIFETIFSLVNPQDEVIIPSPYWVSYPEMVKIAGAKSVFIDTTSNNFKIDPSVLAEAITDKTKLLILNSPSNPTGVVYSRKELEEIAKVINDNNIFCISDEIYEKLIYDDREHISIASLGKEIKERTIVVNGVSKAYSMTGWRIGYAAGPQEVIRLASSLQSHTTSNPTSISQIASIQALEGPQDGVYKMREEFKKRRNYLVERIKNIKYLECDLPEGAFYCFINISAVLGKKINNKIIEGSVSFSKALLEEEKVAIVPGKAFGNDNFVRLSYATSLENIKKGLERIENFVLHLK